MLVFAKELRVSFSMNVCRVAGSPYLVHVRVVHAFRFGEGGAKIPALPGVSLLALYTNTKDG